MENNRRIICEDIQTGFDMLRQDFSSGKLFQVDICQAGVIVGVQRFGADACILCKGESKNTLFVSIGAFAVRLIAPIRIQWMDPGSDPYYQVVVWLQGGTEVIFFFWNK